MNDFMKLTAIFNSNLKKIKRELSLTAVNALYAEYNPEDDGHLAKILSLKGIEL